MGNNKKYAVLTGDIIESSKLNAGQLEKNRVALQNIINEFIGFHPGVVIGNIAYFRGDGWQLLMAEPKYLLRLLLFIACGLKLAEVNNTRVGIAIGSAENINYENISLSTGEAFSKSGKIMNNIENMKVKKNKPLWRLEDKNTYRVLTYEILGAVVNDWTNAVALAIYEALKGRTQQEIADETGVVRQVVGRKLKRGKWTLIKKILAEEENKAPSLGCI